MDPALYDHVRHLIQDRHCHTVRVVVTDCSHVCRSRFVPAKAFLQAVLQGNLTYPSALDSLDSGARFVLEAGSGYDGGFPSWVVKPDLSTWMAVPWAPGAARVMGDLYTASGEPVGHAPRHVLQRVLQHIHNRGWRIRGAFELEFYVFQRDALPALTPIWKGLHCFSEVIQSRIHTFFDAIIQGFEEIGAQPQIANTEY
ncbi:MAG: glutamine synthetase, partial [Alicyclobacillaceae bacterium]|nr:glutamine synthetase [Alicyclobacillaceae bacterium]